VSLANPLLLVAGLLVVGALAVAVVVLGRRRRALLATSGVAGAGWRRSTGIWLSVAGLAVLAVAAAGPTAAVPTPRAAGTVILAVDVSASMTADDVDPDRLAVAQRAAIDLIDAQPPSVDIGVVAFEQGGLTTFAPSNDRAGAAAAVRRLRATGGTSLGQAILTSLSAITGTTVVLDDNGNAPDIGYWRSATIVLFSDGGHESEPEEAGRRAAGVAEGAGVRIETVGVGTDEGASVDVDGFRLHTARDEEELTAIATTSGGSYHPVSDAHGLDDLASTIDRRLTLADEEVPLAGAFVAAALLLLVAGAALTVRRTGRLV
jgi:Ca-activated chloride channel family protein